MKREPIKVVIIPMRGPMRLESLEPTLENFQHIVGGYLEAIGLGDATIYLNEDGKLIGLSVNRTATHIAQDRLALDGRTLLPGDVIVGDVFLVGAPDDEGYDTDAPAWAQRLVLEISGELTG